MTERKKFEAWAIDQGLDVRLLETVDYGHVYADEGTEYAWLSWRAALATPAPAQPDPLHVANQRGEGWHPIESVPKSPVPVLLFTRGGIIRIETGWYAVNLLAEAIENGEECAFTHWAHLPAAPKEKP